MDCTPNKPEPNGQSKTKNKDKAEAYSNKVATPGKDQT